ncbi:hypothetical protein E2C01_025842 [Portunus trituberculatus]|uniref:Uncharacterized protein n=1 Tax=Portunus trituberculatus TaxID=210409 RepID=A0A5B7EE02_PORTR|nr:hypothetical protein [Portunus trituberculatus]
MTVDVNKTVCSLISTDGWAQEKSPTPGGRKGAAGQLASSTSWQMRGLMVSTIWVMCELMGTEPEGRTNTLAPVTASSAPSGIFRFFPGGSPSWLTKGIHNNQQ